MKTGQFIWVVQILLETLRQGRDTVIGPGFLIDEQTIVLGDQFTSLDRSTEIRIDLPNFGDLQLVRAGVWIDVNHVALLITNHLGMTVEGPFRVHL